MFMNRQQVELKVENKSERKKENDKIKTTSLYSFVSVLEMFINFFNRLAAVALTPPCKQGLVGLVAQFNQLSSYVLCVLLILFIFYFYYQNLDNVNGMAGRQVVPTTYILLENNYN